MGLIKIVLCFVLVAIFSMKICASVHTETDGAYLAPTDPVKTIGDEIKFECRSPAGYTGLKFQVIKFVLLHDGTEISESVEVDSVIDVYSIKRFSKAITSKQDAGNYTCIITPSGGGKGVTVSTILFVVEANEMTKIVEIGEETKLSCFDTNDDSTQHLVTSWSVDGEEVDQKSDSLHLVIPKTAKVDALKTYTCRVTSKNAIDAYGSIENATRKGAGAEISRSISVVEVNDCTDKKTCVLEADVYGETAVNITWFVDGKPLIHVPLPESDKNVTKSKTPLLNITSTTWVKLLVTDGSNIWRKNISRAAIDNRDSSSPPVGEIVGGVIGGLIAVAIIAVLVYLVRRRNNPPGEPNADPAAQPFKDSGVSDTMEMKDINGT